MDQENSETLSKSKKNNSPFYRLNIIDDYNYGLDNVDQGDQLQLY